VCLAGVRRQRSGNFRQRRGLVLNQRDQPSDGARIGVTRSFDEVGEVPRC
jgi:hypothetical protein